jgi:hypothetical protein
MQVMSLDPQLERILLQAVAGGGDGASIEPGLADTLVREAVAAAQRQEEVGLPTVLLVPGNLRTLLSRFPASQHFPHLKVLAHGEVPENRTIKVTSIIGQGMNVRKFIAATARDALRKVKETLGPDAIILSNRGIPGGVEIMAVAARDMEMIVPTAEREPGPRRKEAAPGPSLEPHGERPAAPRQAPASAASATSARRRARHRDSRSRPGPSPPLSVRARPQVDLPRSQCRRMRRRRQKSFRRP